MDRKPSEWEEITGPRLEQILLFPYFPVNSEENSGIIPKSRRKSSCLLLPFAADTGNCRRVPDPRFHFPQNEVYLRRFQNTGF
jgi:hypothetical protein